MFRNALTHIFTLRGAVTIGISIIGIFCITILLSQVSLIGSFVGGGAGFGETVKLLWGIFLSIGTLLPGSSIAFIVIVGILFGTNATLGHAYRIRIGGLGAPISATGKGMVALLASLFGVGCAACGPLLLANTIISITGISVLAFLPFGGMEFAFLGALFLVWANFKLVRALNEPLVCKS